MLSPGKFEITDKAMEICKMPKGAKVLEIGCGEGDTTERLEKKYGYDVSAIDLNLEMVSKAKKRGLKADIKYGDGEFLEDFSSWTFDCVTMECVLSLINLPDEALHEAICMLKKGGKLFISDLYIKNPEPEKLKAIKIEAERQAKLQKADNQCSDDCAEEHKKRFTTFRLENRFLLEPLVEELKSIGFKIIHEENRSLDLDNFVAQSVMDGKKIDCNMKGKKDTGYFMLIAEKI